MADVILVLNAGSSSLKFCAFDEEGSGLNLIVCGQVEGLYTAPRFVATGNSGGSVSNEWGERVVRDAAWLGNLGIGIPTLVDNDVPRGIHIYFQSENGLTGTGPIPQHGMQGRYLTNAAGRPN